jgi:hypothetical protein
MWQNGIIQWRTIRENDEPQTINSNKYLENWEKNLLEEKEIRYITLKEKEEFHEEIEINPKKSIDNTTIIGRALDPKWKII